MALFHLHVTQVKRSAGQSVVTSAAYRAGEKLYSEYYGEVSDYTHKGGVVCGQKVADIEARFSCKDCCGEGAVIKKGKKVYHKAVLEEQ